MEGWVGVRVAGQTDWKRFWMVTAAGASDGASVASGASAPRTKRRLSIFSASKDAHSPVPARPTLALYAGPKPKERKRPVLSVHGVRQAFAVYPERPEFIARSTLLKVEGVMGDEDAAGAMKGQEGWVLLMPELAGQGDNHAPEMLRWLVGIHDAFELYGRPAGYTWDPRAVGSMMFAYPVGPQKEVGEHCCSRQAERLTGSAATVPGS
jgi:CCR4-NOT transcriptional complex subunit CAF120